MLDNTVLLFHKVVEKLSDHPFIVSATAGATAIITPDGIIGNIERHALAVLSILIAGITAYDKIKKKLAARRARKAKK